MQIDAAQHLGVAIAGVQARCTARQRLSHARAAHAARTRRRAVAQIGLDRRARSAATCAAMPSRDDAAFGQHEDVLGETHHRLHDMLDHQDGDAAVAEGPDHRHDVANLGRIEPGHHFVEQQQLRLGRQRAGELQPLAPRDGQRRAGRVEHVAEADRARDLVRPRRARRRAAMAQMGADAMFSRTVRPAKGCTIWNVRAMPRRASRCGGTPVMSSPA